MVFLCIACIVLSSIALHGIALHCIAWHCMLLQRLHGVVQLIWRAGELPRSASSHFWSFPKPRFMSSSCTRRNGNEVGWYPSREGRCLWDCWQLLGPQPHLLLFPTPVEWWKQWGPRCKNAYVWEVSGWCLWVSGSYLGVSGRCLVEYNVTKINSWIEVVISSYCLFSQWPPINQKVLYFRVSVGCLDGVWKVSWGCLSDSGWLRILYGRL